VNSPKCQTDHIYNFRGEQVLEGRFSYRSRYNPNSNDDENPDLDYRPMQDVFSQKHTV
jgi:hypothetical protein